MAQALPRWTQRLAFALGVAAFALAAAGGFGYAVVVEGRLPAIRSEYDLRQSAEDLEGLAALQPRNPMIVAQLGLELAAEGRNAEAIRVLERALLLNPVPVAVHERLAVLYLRQGRVEMARRQVRAAHGKGGRVDDRVLRAVGLVRTP